MKKTLSLLLALLLCIALPVAAEVAATETTVYVSITDGSGALVLAYAPVAVTDTDADGVLTINDALELAHVAYHADGGDAFTSETTQYGLSMTELWGVENGGAYGYCVNNASAMSLADPIQADDHIKAYVYTDLVAWSDTYCYFENAAVAAAVNGEVALTLFANGYDANWAPIVLNVAGATLTINGEKTDVQTDAEGKAVLTFAEAGTYIVSAVSDSQVLVAPVCIVTVK